jgi:hypothetical protein
MRIEYGFISKVDRDDQSNSKDWKFIGTSAEDLVEFLNDCDDSDATELTSENLSEVWFRVDPEWYATK